MGDIRLQQHAATWADAQRESLLLDLLPPLAAALTLPARTSCVYLLQVWRYYLVPVATREPELRLDFDSELFMLDARSATVRRCEVRGSSGRRL